MKRSAFFRLLTAVLMLAGSMIAQAQSAVGPGTAQGVPEMTASDLGAFLDGALPPQLAREDIAGAVVETRCLRLPAWDSCGSSLPGTCSVEV